MQVFHVSDREGIEQFEPRPSRAGEALVWAVSAPRLPNYMLPRECPRVTWYAANTTSAADRERFFAGATRVVAIEAGWLQRVLNTRLFVYAFDVRAFVLHNATAGYYVAREPVRPTVVKRIDAPLRWLLDEQVEVRVLPTLWPLREAVAQSTLGFSIIRFRNAAPPPPGFVSRFEVSA